MSSFQAAALFPNGLLWLMSEDGKQIEVPDVDGVANFWTSQNAWGIAVLHDADGTVQVSIGDSPPDGPALALLHEGVLHSSRQLIEVQTVYIEPIARFRTRSTDAGISIWGDDPGQPERIHIQCQDIEGEVVP
ncbi:hypothetical protein HTS88_21395 [Pseudarthrobacter oxydans]|uniref:hypothetical protein n=1 Tax=Pseudarthrobacter oxydans TaxID=1671 RepID=UPI0015723FC7|nr:hypothetical protein [Pseudarthrobacter oxydans]NSX38933.1 hypothetical protein [Pseudarthrobacter oxydans]